MSNDLGLDRSGNGNDWTVNNIAYSDQMLDSPTNNFPTWSPLTGKVGYLPTLSEGNLAVATQGVMASMSMESGRWYWEVLATSSDADYAVGVTDIADANSTVMSGQANPAQGFIYQANGNVRKDGAVVDVVPSFTNGDIIGFLYDALWNGYANHLTVFKNNSQVVHYTLTTARNEYIPCAITLNGSFTANFGQDSSFAGAKTAQGKQDANGIGDFYYTPPKGIDSGTSNHFALCTKNLPDVAVVPSKKFNAVLYTGTGSSNTQNAGGVTDGVDFLWTKCRSHAKDHILVNDIIGGNNNLSTNTANGENTNANRSITLADSSFTLNSNSGHLNEANKTYVSWLWKANGSGSSNTNGNIDSTVSADVDAGFSIVSYTGTGNNDTVGHGLSKAPEMVIAKRRSSSEVWGVYHAALGATKVINLNQTGAAYTYAIGWNNTAPTASVFSLGTWGGVNGSSQTNIAYAFHSVDGYSKVGSYVGNGNVDGTFVYTGFRPAFVLIKNTSANGTYWHIADSKRLGYNVVGQYLFPNTNEAESNYTEEVLLDITSNGFKLRGLYSHINGNGNTMMYYAVAETPFKYSNAR